MRLTNTVGAILAIGVLGFAACGGDDTSPDARVNPADGGDIDAGTPDGMVPGPCGSNDTCGSISVQEIRLNGVPQFGQGPQVSIGFDSNTYKPATIPGPLIGGCSATDYGPADLAAQPGLDEGTVQITHTPFTPAAQGVTGIPFGPCNFVTGVGYLCINDAGQANMVVTSIDANTAVVTRTAGTWPSNVAATYINISGFANAGNNGAFPVAQLASAQSLVIINPGHVDEATPAAATYTILSGQGPNPAAPQPNGYIGDDDGLTITLTKGGDMDFETFTATFAAGAGMGVGDDFTLDTASQALISGLPGDGTMFKLSCSGAGGDCGSATGAILTITTTDADLATVGPFSIPDPTAHQVAVTCTTLAANGDLTVNSDISGLIMSSVPTRARTTYLRSNLVSQAGGAINVIAGHGIVGFTNFAAE